MNRKAIFILDSPINAFVASVISKNFDSVEVIYAIDNSVKNEQDYKKIFQLILSEVKINKEMIVTYDSRAFWSLQKKEVLKEVSKKLKDLGVVKESGTIVYGNCLTNPVALVYKKYSNLHHLYHSPGDFANLLLSSNSQSFFKKFKHLMGAIFNIPITKIDTKNPISTLVQFKLNLDLPFQFINYIEFNSKEIEKQLEPLSTITKGQKHLIMLLLAGDEPTGPGDNNILGIAKYLTAHLDSVKAVMERSQLQKATIWIKEHKTYLPLTIEERQLLVDEFNKLGCSVFFIRDILNQEMRLIPGECILRYCDFNYIIGEPSAFLFNVANGPVIPFVAITQFESFRNKEQILRNKEFEDLNILLTKPCRTI